MLGFRKIDFMIDYILYNFIFFFIFCYVQRLMQDFKALALKYEFMWSKYAFAGCGVRLILDNFDYINI